MWQRRNIQCKILINYRQRALEILLPSKSFPFLTGIAITKKKTMTEVCIPYPQEPNHEITLTKFL